ncbi:hypothetical protein B0813_002203 [Candidatus Fervidibacteria bacterium JGI MDM2 SSWTFF-3-K9]
MELTTTGMPTLPTFPVFSTPCITTPYQRRNVWEGKFYPLRRCQLQRFLIPCGVIAILHHVRSQTQGYYGSHFDGYFWVKAKLRSNPNGQQGRSLAGQF